MSVLMMMYSSMGLGQENNAKCSLILKTRLLRLLDYFMWWPLGASLIWIQGF